MMMQRASTWLYKGHKLVVMCCINFKDHVLIKKWWVSKKMNVTSRKFKDKKNRVIVENNLCLLLKVVRIFKILEFTAT
jgi:hypothetical protein